MSGLWITTEEYVLLVCLTWSIIRESASLWLLSCSGIGIQLLLVILYTSVLLVVIRLEFDIHCLTMKSTNLFLFSFDDNSGLHCLIFVFGKSFCTLNSPEERLFSLHPLLNYFHKRQKQHQFFLIDFHLVKHTLTNVQQIGYM